MKLKDYLQPVQEDTSGIFNLEKSLDHQEYLLTLGLVDTEDLHALDLFLRRTADWIWDDDSGKNAPSKIGFSGAFYGKDLPNREEIYKSAVVLLKDNIGYEGDVPDITESSGFDRLRQMEGGLTDWQYRVSEMIVSKELVQDALAKINLEPSDVDLFLAATSIPIHPRFHEEWKLAAGIPKDVPVVPFCMACNSSGRAMAEVLLGTFDEKIAEYNPAFKKGKPANIVLLALDDANRLAMLGADPMSPQLFSTGAGAVAWQYHPTSESSMKMIAHTSQSIEAGTNALKVVRSYDSWTDEEREGLYTAEFLKSPAPGEGFMKMQARAGFSFKENGFKVAMETMAKYQELGYGPTDIRRVIVHHPSLGVFNLLKAALLEQGFADEQINWVINEGNVPVATIPFAFGRQMEDLRPNDHVLFLSFGAGGEYTCFVAEMGSPNAI